MGVLLTHEKDGGRTATIFGVHRSAKEQSREEESGHSGHSRQTLLRVHSLRYTLWTLTSYPLKPSQHVNMYRET